MAYGGYKSKLNEAVLDERGLLHQRVIWFREADPEYGTVRWIGRLREMGNEIVAGVELDNPVGTNDGKWGDRQLFVTQPKHGLVIPISGLLKDELFAEHLPKEYEDNTDVISNNAEFSNTFEELTPLEFDNKHMMEPSQIKMKRTRKYSKHHARFSKTNAREVNALEDTTLLMQLKIAIAEGEGESAARLSRKLARLKVNCLFSPKESIDFSAENIFLNLYIEDQVSQIGCLAFQVQSSMTVKQLKLQVEEELGFPIYSQNWIFGKKIATNDDFPISSYDVTSNGCTAFLYLSNNVASRTEIYKEKLERYLKAVADDEIIEIHSSNDVVNELDDFEVMEQYGNQKIILIAEEQREGWVCPSCTLLNFPTRPGCCECATARPEDYVVPLQFKLSPEEELRLQKEREMDEAFKQEQEKREMEKQQRKKENYQRFLELDAIGLVSNEESFECPVCFTEFERGDGVKIRDCLHVFCKDCLARTVEYCEEAEVKCPYVDNEYACPGIIQAREVRAIVTPEMFDRYLQRSVTIAESQAENSFHCKTTDCRGWCLYDDEHNEFLCPICKHNNCVTCQAIHENQTCKEYQDKVELESRTNDEARKTKAAMEEMLAKGDAMRCPKCQIVIMKKSGCDWMQCTMCKTGLCWVTKGARWGPQGEGDRSGGCHCRENGGPPCHPQCQGCH